MYTIVHDRTRTQSRKYTITRYWVKSSCLLINKIHFQVFSPSLPPSLTSFLSLFICVCVCVCEYQYCTVAYIYIYLCVCVGSFIYLPNPFTACRMWHKVSFSAEFCDFTLCNVKTWYYSLAHSLVPSSSLIVRSQPMKHVVNRNSKAETILLQVYNVLKTSFTFCYTGCCTKVKEPSFSITMEKIWINAFPNGISAKWNAYSFVLNLNSVHRVHFLRR